MQARAAVAAVLSPAEIAAELAHCRVSLPPAVLEQLSTYLELLLHWNRRINLTGLRDPKLIVRRLFGESLYIAQVLDLQGWLVDVGSGAGFPGLALKLGAPSLKVTLVEARHRKGAFLKEVIRECRFAATDVVVERFEVWCDSIGKRPPDCITTRAVRMSSRLLSLIAGTLRPNGVGVFVTSPGLALILREQVDVLRWEQVVDVPGSPDSVLVLGRR